MGNGKSLCSSELWKGLEVHLDITSNDYNIGYAHLKLSHP